MSENERSFITLPDIKGSPDEIIKAIEDRAVLAKRMKIALLAVCNPKDFQKMGDTYYMRETAANKLAMHMGVSTCIESIERIELEKGDYQYIVRGWGQCHKLAGEKTSFTGQAQASRPFYRKQWLNGTLDPGHIMQAACTNFRVTAISRLLGMQNITKEEMAQAKIEASEINEVQYDDSGKTHGEIQNATSATEIVEKHTELQEAGKHLGGAEKTVIVPKEFGVKLNAGGGSWKIRAWCKDAEGRSYSTFDEGVAGVLLWCSREESPCAIDYTVKDGKYNNICYAGRYDEEIHK